MKNKTRSKILLFSSFSLTFTVTLFLFFWSLPISQAADVNVSACVPGTEICNNTIDDNCNGLVDCNDGDCTGNAACTLAEICDNGIDDNFNGLIDCDDPACTGHPHCSGSCFLAGTEIALADGAGLPIEAVRVGDRVLSYNEKSQSREAAVVLQTFKHQADQYLLINNQLAVTANHPMYVNGGWSSAGQVKVGDKILTVFGLALTVSSVEITAGDFLVYNLTVDKNHNYFAENYLVHNKGGESACGNGIQESGEECDDGNLVSGDGCSSACQLEVCGNNRIDFGEECDHGALNSNTNPNACRTNCHLAYCGDQVVDTGEECDDGNTTAGDGCSSTCQTETGCGNGVVEPSLGEECDDDNIVSGDCCSSTCQWELTISNVTESVTNTTATIGWSILCAPPTVTVSSQLEWGKTIAVNEGLASGFIGLSNQHTITGLEPNLVYYYLISAAAGSLVDTYANSFHTLGGLEICDNGIDDDRDGFCDYPASTCLDGSVSGDSNCPCTPVFFCSTSLCENDWRTITCVDQSVPKCQPDDVRTENCGVCPGVIIGTCQALDEATCTVYYRSNCCGNNICEPPAETPVNCLVDCPAVCISDWQCTAWQPEPCPVSGIQTRNCFDQNTCEVPINPPDTQRACSGECSGLSCGSCQQINLSQCTCEELVPCCGNGICENGETHELCSQDCILVCRPNWTCSGWGQCVNNTQQRECYDLNNCNLSIGRPPEVRSCDSDCEVACSICQEIDLVNCRCLPITPCCGNRSCETSETGWSCPVDCSLPPNLFITLPVCLDGLDNDHDGLVDYPADPGCSKPSDNSELSLVEVLANINRFLLDKILDNPAVETVNQRFAAPTIIAIATVNALATFSFFNLLSYLRYLFTQPFAALFRRKRKKWGIVYNALSKQPVDLAIVRLYQKANGQLIQSRVTDKQGRYAFIAAPGEYYLTVTKPKLDFPTVLLKDKKEDGQYLDLYHGENVIVTDRNVAITANIPLDPQEDAKPAAKVIFQYYLRKVQYGLAFAAVPLAAVSLAISPSPFTFSLFGFHCLMYALFRRLGYQRPPKSWGIVYDKTTTRPLGHAITRIYDRHYNKLLETRVADAKGRYAFLVDNNVYYLTADKTGYKTAKSPDIDLMSKTREAMVGMNIGLEKGQLGQVTLAELSSVGPTPITLSTPTPPAGKVGLPASIPPAEPVKVQPTPEPVKPIQPVVPPVEKPALTQIPALEQEVESLGVGRKSLEELLKAKESVQAIKEDITEEKEKLEVLEEKVDDLAKNLEEKIEPKDLAQPKVDQEVEQIKEQPSAPAADSIQKVEPPPVSPPTNPPAASVSPTKDVTSTPPEKSIFG